MADPLNLLALSIDLGVTIARTASLVKRRKSECLELSQRVVRLQLIVRTWQSGCASGSTYAQLPLPTLSKLVDLLRSADDLVKSFADDKPTTVFGRIYRVGNRFWKAENDVDTFLYLNWGLDSILAEVNVLETNRINETLRLQSEHQGSNLELFYREDPPTDNLYDDRSVMSRGMFSTTNRMKNALDDHIYAVKRVRVAELEQIGVLKRTLVEECAKLHRLSHPHIGRYFINFDSHHHKIFNIVMELIEGGPLLEKITCTPPPTEAEIVEWARQMASALSYMHEEGVLHSDLNPRNVMLTAKSIVKIIGFGAARNASSAAVATSSAVGSDNYASYEKFQGIGYDGRDDVWAVGCILLELLLRQR
jgi:tRNA A-37 threonylcarbamoyl transferase component Bud32